jgi:ABC-type branched-subunit amino acid transport system ATPase component
LADSPDTTLLKVDKLSRYFDGVVAVDAVTFEVNASEVFGVIGPNGAGKTTLLNCISGIVSPQSGTVYLGEVRLDALKPHQVARHGVARTFQVAESFRSFTVADYVLLGRIEWRPSSLWKCGLSLPAMRHAEREQRNRVFALIEEHGLSDFANETLGGLPYGHQKLVDVVRALAAEPKLLLLDEPTSGSSTEERQALQGLVKSLKDTDITVVVVDHDVTFVADCCARVLAMANGANIGLGTPAEVLASRIVVDSYLGTHAGSGELRAQV